MGHNSRYTPSPGFGLFNRSWRTIEEVAEGREA